MTADEQLLTKQVIGNMSIVPSTISVRFNLQRGKIARIWGFVFGIDAIEAPTRTWSLFVRKTPNSPRQATPQDILWLVLNPTNITTSGVNLAPSQGIMFPKPHRTSGITVQMHCTTDTTNRGVLVIYYDIADVMKGELVQKWEKNISKGRTGRTIAP